MVEKTIYSTEIVQHMTQPIYLIINYLSLLFSQIETKSKIFKMEDMKEQIIALQTSLEALTARLTIIERPAVVEEYTDEVPITTKASLSAIKALPEFHGKAEEYPSWRNLITMAMKYTSKTESENYLNALLMIKAKIRGPAAAILSNHGTSLNFNAIIDRLDYSYADQRAMYVVEQELIVLQQGQMTVHEFYDRINEKLNIIITKIHITHQEKVAADTLIENMREKALRTIITGLSNCMGDGLYSANPKTLAEAYARLQTILSDRERMTFATQYNRNGEGSNYIQRHRKLRFVMTLTKTDRKTFSTKNRTQNQPPFVEKRERYDFQRNPNFTSKNERPIANKQPNNDNTNKNEPMEIDASTMQVNVENKRNFNSSGSNQYSRQHKFQRVNNIENEIDDYEENNDDIDETQSVASIFIES